MAKIGQAILYMEADEQYTLLIFSQANESSDMVLESTIANSTLSNAFNSARDALAAMATGPLRHKRIEITTRIA